MMGKLSDTKHSRLIELESYARDNLDLRQSPEWLIHNVATWAQIRYGLSRLTAKDYGIIVIGRLTQKLPESAMSDAQLAKGYEELDKQDVEMKKGWGKVAEVVDD